MNKNDILHKLHQAKRDHLAWVGRAELLAQGIEVSKELIPVLHTDCRFGHWYFGEGQALTVFPEFREIDEAHRALHQSYTEIFKLITETENPSLFSRLVGKARRQQKQNEPVIKSKLQKLESESHRVLQRLEALEGRLREMDDTEFAQKLEVA